MTPAHVNVTQLEEFIEQTKWEAKQYQQKCAEAEQQLQAFEGEVKRLSQELRIREDTIENMKKNIASTYTIRGVSNNTISGEVRAELEMLLAENDSLKKALLDIKSEAEERENELINEINILVQKANGVYDEGAQEGGDEEANEDAVQPDDQG